MRQKHRLVYLVFVWSLLGSLFLTACSSEATGVPIVPTQASANLGAAQPKTVVGTILVPDKLAFSENLLSLLKLPAGFKVSIFAQNLGHLRMMAVNSDGTTYVTRRDQGDVLALFDRDKDGRLDEVLIVADQLRLVHGITINQNKLYLATDKKVLVADIRPDGKLANFQTLISDLPDAGQHPNRTLAFGSDNLLYITVGSTCNACVESNLENATILQVQPDGSKRTIFAEGLRNTIGFGWHPQTGQMWGMDHGTDWRGDDQPPEELNRLQQGGNYGWPFCYGGKEPDEYLPANPKGETKQEYCAKTLAPELMNTAHSAPIGMVFYNGKQFPADYQGDAFVAMRGSWNRNPPSGYKVVRVRFQDGQPTGIEDFMSGFLVDNTAYFARISGIAVAADGALLVADDSHGVIYRVTYSGSTTATKK